MRLSPYQVKIIKEAVTEVFGQDAKVMLFGSRVNDNDKGGDIDLYVTIPQIIERPARDITRLQSKIMMQLGERKIDVVLDAPNLTSGVIQQVAEKTGIVL